MDNTNSEQQQKRKNRSKKKKKKSILFKILIGFLIVLFIAVLSVGGYFLGMYNKLNTVTIDKGNLGIDSKEEFKEYDNVNKIKNIALFGVDQLDGNAGRSDSIMVATLDPVHNKLKITSIMRDSYVNIEGHGMDKINHAYAFGGPELAIKTINQNFGLNIENFVTVDFSSLPKIIDNLGGIQIEIRADEVDFINDYINTLNTDEGTHSANLYSSGYQTLDGIQALAYSRVRYTSGGDYERTERQRTVLNALFEKLLSISPSEYPTIASNLMQYVQTNLTISDVLSLGTKVLGLGNGTLEQDRFPRDGSCNSDSIDGVYYLTFNIDEIKHQMRDYIFNDK